MLTSPSIQWHRRGRELADVEVMEDAAGGLPGVTTVLPPGFLTPGHLFLRRQNFKCQAWMAGQAKSTPATAVRVLVLPALAK